MPLNTTNSLKLAMVGGMLSQIIAPSLTSDVRDDLGLTDGADTSLVVTSALTLMYFGSLTLVIVDGNEGKRIEMLPPYVRAGITVTGLRMRPNALTHVVEHDESQWYYAQYLHSFLDIGDEKLEEFYLPGLVESRDSAFRKNRLATDEEDPHELSDLVMGSLGVEYVQTSIELTELPDELVSMLATSGDDPPKIDALSIVNREMLTSLMVRASLIVDRAIMRALEIPVTVPENGEEEEDKCK